MVDAPVWQMRVQTLLVMAVANLLLLALFFGDLLMVAMASAQGAARTADWVVVVGAAALFAVAGLSAPRKRLAVGLAPLGALALALMAASLIIPPRPVGAGFPTATASLLFGLVAIVATGGAAAIAMVRTSGLAVPPPIQVSERQ